MIRVTTGTAKNKRLKTPEIEGFRAVQEIAKLSLFSIIGDKIENAACLDLFAGSGNLGIEALSRGAYKCDFVDENPVCTETIEENLNNCGLLGNGEVFLRDSLKYILNTENTYDLIFLDPFYMNTSYIHLFKNIGRILNNNGMIVFFHGKENEPEQLIKETELEIKDKRKFGKSFFTLITK